MGYKKEKRKSIFDVDDDTPADSIVTNNSLVPNFSRYFFESSNRPHPYSTKRTFQHPIPDDEGFDWKVREAANEILSKHNLPKF
jgi:hypothetical protein